MKPSRELEDAKILGTETKSHWELVKSAAHPKYLFRKPSVWEPQQQAPLERHFAVWVWALACLRIMNLALWATLMGMYFTQVDGEFPEWHCSDDNTIYCTKQLGALQTDCSPTGRMCSVNQKQSVPVLVYLTLSQSLLFYLKRATLHVSLSQSVQNLRFAGLFMWLSAQGALFLLFLLEGFALPFGTIHGQIAFAPFESRGLEITVYLALTFLLLATFTELLFRMFGLMTGLLASIVCLPCACCTEKCDCNKVWSRSLVDARWIRKSCAGNCFRTAGRRTLSRDSVLDFLNGMGIVALLVHSLVALVLYVHNNWLFVSEAMFFVAFEKEFLGYRVTRSLFSTLSIVEALVTFIVLNMVRKGFNLNSVTHWIPRLVLLWPVQLSSAAEGGESTAVVDALEKGDLTALKALQKRGKFQPATVVANGSLPIVLAARSNQLHILQWLVNECKINPKQPDNNGISPLHWACREGRLEVIQWLVRECKMDPALSEKDGMTALHWACCGGQLDVVQWLVTKHGIDPSLPDNDGRTPLQWACLKSWWEVAHWLVTECKADPNLPDKNGMTALHWACQQGQLEVVKWLVSTCQMDPNFPDKSNMTALQWAWKNGQWEVEHWLKTQSKMDPTQRGDDNRPQLHRACEKGQLDVVKRLVTECKMDPNLPDKNGMTALHWACREGYLQIVKWLIVEAKVDGKFSDKNGMTALHWACYHGQLEMIKWLMTNCYADLNLPDNDGHTPLQWACLQGRWEVIKWLVTEGKADPSLPNKQGQTAIAFAKNGNPKLAMWMENAKR